MNGAQTDNIGDRPAVAATRGGDRCIDMKPPALGVICLMLGLAGFFIAAYVAMNPL